MLLYHYRRQLFFESIESRVITIATSRYRSQFSLLDQANCTTLSIFQMKMPLFLQVFPFHRPVFFIVYLCKDVLKELCYTDPRSSRTCLVLSATNQLTIEDFLVHFHTDER